MLDAADTPPLSLPFSFFLGQKLAITEVRCDDDSPSDEGFFLADTFSSTADRRPCRGKFRDRVSLPVNLFFRRTYATFPDLCPSARRKCPCFPSAFFFFLTFRWGWTFPPKLFTSLPFEIDFPGSCASDSCLQASPDSVTYWLFLETSQSFFLLGPCPLSPPFADYFFSALYHQSKGFIVCPFL